MSTTLPLPKPLFDSLDYFDDSPCDHAIHPADYRAAIDFLRTYRGSQATFNAYRREIERLLQWCSHITNKSLHQLRRKEIEEYIAFCQAPPTSWIGVKKVPRFLTQQGQRLVNPTWRPFVAHLSKAAHRRGQTVKRDHYVMSEGAIKDLFAILSSFFNFLIQDNYLEINPILQIRQKSRFIRRQQSKAKVRRLSERQWHYLLQAAEQMANNNPVAHERTLFIITALYAMYLRISELAASPRWTPQMCHFYRDHDENWWFITVGKGNKERQIAVSNAMLSALKRWRQYLNLSPLPSPADQTPLLPKQRSHGAITSTTYLREIIQSCFDQAMVQLKIAGHLEEAEALLDATVHWLRHTGISDDVKLRPREHVRDDAGHSSGAITDRYIDIELQERHRSARGKPIKAED
ncbi:MAG: tyrosine-type recombinase/integrase [Gammaproteobacteria bacterium]|nr:tyrosine-type recombinase/integrase [Gammaproteobacteria bacterium]